MSLVTCHGKFQVKTLRNSYNSVKGFALCLSQTDIYVNFNNSYIKSHIYDSFWLIDIKKIALIGVLK